jgi:DNA topoisomerase IB
MAPIKIRVGLLTKFVVTVQHLQGITTLLDRVVTVNQDTIDIEGKGHVLHSSHLLRGHVLHLGGHDIPSHDARPGGTRQT